MSQWCAYMQCSRTALYRTLREGAQTQSRLRPCERKIKRCYNLSATWYRYTWERFIATSQNGSLSGYLPRSYGTLTNRSLPIRTTLRDTARLPSVNSSAGCEIASFARREFPSAFRCEPKFCKWSDDTALPDEKLRSTTVLPVEPQSYRWDNVLIGFERDLGTSRSIRTRFR